MKPELDKEIDALLRDRARREGLRSDVGSRDGASVPDVHSSGRADAPSAHLDADELSAFAEQALPDAARTRYAAHLADCDDCRRTATRLALAANVAVARDEHELVAGRDVSASKEVAATWRERVAALFAPRAWRYAMPVVALLCVGVVALVLMRRVPNDDLQIARNGGAAQVGESNEQTSAENHAESAPPASQPLAQSPAQTQGSDDASPTATGAAANDNNVRREAVANNQIAKDQNEPQQVGGVVAGAASSATSAGTVERQRVEELPSPPKSAESVTVTTPASTPSPLPPPPAPAAMPTPSREDEIASVNAAPKEDKSETAQTKTRRAERRSGKTNENGTNAASPMSLSASEANNSPANRGAAGGAMMKTRQPDTSDDDAKKSKSLRDKSSAETRAVGGRKFRREGGAWVDTAYNSAQATTIIRRHSEQYRALIADEPEISRIADALGGEVVIVWKGRAYRIKP